MEPIPETREVLKDLIKSGEDQVAEDLFRMGRLARDIVPECVGLSLALVQYGLTFTLAATSEQIAGLDAVQYLDGGPCVDAAHAGRDLEVEQDELLDETQWQMYSQASAAAGVASSLTLPVLDSYGTVIGTINLYASTLDAFRDRLERLAKALGASAAKAVSNADLSFSSRLEAAEAPRRLADQRDIDIAVGMIAASQHVHTATAGERLRAAASRAGITELQAARAVRGVLFG
jgi:transcriptional regulator with GAF, ATPase, and Fis domain